MNLTEIRRVLDGDIEALENAFWWTDTPQGFHFWDDQYNAGELSPEGRKALEEFIS
jgi:hypothetical protein